MKLSLRYKAALYIAATQMALLGLLLVTNLTQTRQYLEEDLALHANSMAEVVATSATEPLLSMDLAQLKKLVDGVVMKYRIEHVRIADHRGQVLASAGQPGDQAQRVHVERPILVAGSLFGTVRVEVSRAETATAIARNTRNNVMIALLELGLVALISLTLGWFLTRNLGTLARATQAIGDGDYTARAPITAADEVGELATRFNAMAEQLQNHVSELAGSQRRFRELADDTSDWIWETDADGRYTYVSNRAEEIVGFAPEQLIGSSAFAYMGAADAERLGKLFAAVRAEQRAFYGFEYAAVRADGAVVQLEANGRPILDAAGNVIGYRGVTRDVSRRKDDEARLVYLAEHDPLTGLISRHRFLELLDDEVRLAAARGSSLAVLFVDLDDFKLINDTHGHVAGDALLRLASEALRGAAGASTPIARIGGDEFGVLARAADATAARELAQQLLAAIDAAPLAIGKEAIRLAASVGVCLYPEGAQDSETLLAHADIAMSRAKAHGHGHYHLFEPADADAENMRRTVNWQSELRAALLEGRLQLEFQPIMRVGGRRRQRYVEALVRMRGPDGELHAASRFMDTAEYTGQVAEIDKWVLEEVLALLADPKQADLRVSMNVSGRSLGSPGFDAHVAERLRASAIDPGRLVFEITETAVVAEMARARSFLSTMKSLGYRFSLDDFGVGYSSFSYLKHLPVDQIKIDGSFIRQLDRNREDQIFVRAIVQVAQELGLETVAEFVESRAALDLLQDMQIDYVQGHYIGRPAPAPQFAGIEPQTAVPKGRKKRSAAP